MCPLPLWLERREDMLALGEGARCFVDPSWAGEGEVVTTGMLPKHMPSQAAAS